MPLSIEELIERQAQLADRFESYEPTPDDEGSPSLIIRIYLAARTRTEAERRLSAVVDEARLEGVPWRAIGEAIGTSGEAARQRYGHHTPVAEEASQRGQRAAHRRQGTTAGEAEAASSERAAHRRRV